MRPVDSEQPGDRRRLAPALGVITALGLLGALMLATASGPTFRPGTNSPSNTLPELSETEADISWSAVEGPEDVVRVETLLPTPHGFVVISGPRDEGATLWTTLDGSTWTASPVAMSPYGIVADRDAIVAFREEIGFRFEFDGRTWIETNEVELPTYVRSASLSGRPGLVYADGAVFAHSIEGELYHATEGGAFNLVVERGVWTQPDTDPWERFTAPLAPTGCQPPAAGSPDYPPLVETSGGFVAFLPADKAGPSRVWPVCDPQLWTSADGMTWQPGPADPFPPQSYVYDVAARDGAIVAVGGQSDTRPGAWVSRDGSSWDSLTGSFPGSAGHVFTDVVAGPLGWIVLGDAVGQRTRRGWFSPDAQCWQTIPDEVAGQAAAIGTGAIMMGSRDGATGLWVGRPAETGSNCG